MLLIIPCTGSLCACGVWECFTAQSESADHTIAFAGIVGRVVLPEARLQGAMYHVAFMHADAYCRHFCYHLVCVGRTTILQRVLLCHHLLCHCLSPCASGQPF